MPSSASRAQKAGAAPLAVGGDDSMTRSYASKDYWERRYKRKAASGGAAAAPRPPARKQAARSRAVASAPGADAAEDTAAARGGGRDSERERDVAVAVEEADETDEWFFNYENVKFLLIDNCTGQGRGDRRPRKDEVTVLDVGCGNSPFLADMARDGWKGQLHACDFSKMALVAFEAKCQTAGIPCVWKDPLGASPKRESGSQSAHRAGAAAARGTPIALTECDCRHLSRHFPATRFDVIIDKGTMDAMLSEEDPDVRFDGVRQYFEEATRLLNTGGSIVLMSHMGVAGAMAHERNWLEESLVPALLSGNDNDASDAAEKRGARWTIDVHSSEGAADSDDGEAGGDDDEEEEEEEQSESDGPSVWIIRKHPRGPRTRAQPEPFVMGDIEQHIH